VVVTYLNVLGQRLTIRAE